MSTYRSILVAIDLSNEADQVLEKAKTLAAQDNASLTLMHVVEPVGYAYGGDLPLDLTELQEQLEEQAKGKLADYGQRYGLSPEQQKIVVGRPGAEVKRTAKEGNYDLIIVGSHGRHGIQLLLGSTASSILHGAEVDVLAVRVKSD